MRGSTIVRWWPPIGVVAMLALGDAVGRSATTVDAWFVPVAHEAVGMHPRWMLIVTDWWFLGPVLAACAAAALYRRRWRLAALVAATPFVAIEITEGLKRVFNRRIDGALAYPSGHMSLVVAVMGLVVVAAGYRLWAIAVAMAVCLVAMVGLGCTYHYLTDTVGAVLLSTAVVCVAARLAGHLQPNPSRANSAVAPASGSTCKHAMGPRAKGSRRIG